ncbi:DDE-type integrase/transposase/recombinase [Saccharicrinis sp. GN24d3]|uniref:DDE-type integrase/transposase/recombinase n=1 Tax=Saccharicrinis sp. GN24d3 TaxID=3458416 RepID=UPI0040370552
MDKDGNTIGCLIIKRRMKGFAQKYLNKAIGNNSIPRVISIDKSGANKEGIMTFNKRNFKNVKWRQCKCLNNIAKQDHRNIKRKIVISRGFKDLESAQ